MMSSANDNKLSNDTSCSDLLILLTSMISSSETSNAAPSLKSVSPQELSFEHPFDDPDLEPLPLEPQGSLRIPSMVESSTFITRDSCLPCSFLEPKLLPTSDTNVRINLFDLVGSKRSSTFSDVKEDCFRPIKRQRTYPVQAADPASEENTARFRPYQEKQWVAMFQKLIQFKLEYGSCCVPYSYTEDPTLAR